ncbi:Pc22g18510 [Penicillium rubens Wisconsin 54-1255]|uniref:Pc22g18510 protein n=1 Tax=Penicillium rubens (strain ATCC 28089 / DSM 1075 / NRRL 1951 / Wisconsin 54-1255) TaxID=500485 RepID=B6HUM3_PENRW|nr:Pc22g18510 [Penicillium rubens Wisconsin 54-1255]
MWAIGLVKISIGLFLLRFAPRKGYKVFIWVVIVLMTLYTAICFLLDSLQTLIFQCQDIRSNWDSSVKSKCYTPTQLLTLSYTNTALNILTDLIFAVLPVFMLRACAAAFVKLSILPNYGRTGDFLWDYTNLTIWVVTECNTGIMAGTLPTLKPLFKRFLGTYGSQSKTSRQYPGSKKYKMHSMSRSRGPPLQSRHKSGNLSIAEYDAEPNIQRSQIASTAGSATYAGSRGSNSSEERILPVQGDGIVRTTEVIVSREQNIPEPPPSPPVVSKLSRMGSLSGLRVNAEDRV